MSHPLLNIIGNERRWCGWGGTKGTAPERPKAPATADGWPMKWSDSANWMGYAEVEAAIGRGTIKGAGYFTSNGDHPELIPLTVIDLDNCVADGVIVGEWQRAVVEALDGLVLASPSGRGVHIPLLAARDFTAPEIVAVKGDDLRGYEVFNKAHHVRLGTTVLHDKEPRLLTREVWNKIAALLPGWLDEQAAITAPKPTQPQTPITPPDKPMALRAGKLTEKQISYAAAAFCEKHDLADMLAKRSYDVALKARKTDRGMLTDVARPGKKLAEGTSGNIQDGKIYYPFSNNDGLEANKGYTAFGAWAAFEHNGDQVAAAWAADALLNLKLWQPPEDEKMEDLADDDEHALDGTQTAKGKGSKAADKPTDDDLARRWLDERGNVAHGLGEFRSYSQGYWPEIERPIVEKEILDVMCLAKGEGIRPNSGNLASVEKLASVIVGVSETRWDADPDLLVCKNGTLHIPTMELRDHSPEDYLTSGLPYDYDPTADCPAFLGAIRSTVPEAEGFLQEFFGLALTTETKYEIAPWLYGPPGSGKSTIIEGANTMLGSRVINLGLSDIERSRFALGKLPGKTLAISTEQPTLYMKASDVLNKVISGESITVERKYREPVEIMPKVKFLWAMNELPRVPDANNGLFRRVKVIRFPRLAGAPDINLKAKIRLEAAGILNWALAGLLRLMNRGCFDVPVCVTDATAQFQRENDVPATFVADCCLTGPEFRTGGQQLYDAYKAWCLRNSHKPQSSTTLAEDWVRLGFEAKKSNGRRIYVGIGLLTPSSDTDEESSGLGAKVATVAT